MTQEIPIVHDSFGYDFDQFSRSLEGSASFARMTPTEQLTAHELYLRQLSEDFATQMALIQLNTRRWGISPETQAAGLAMRERLAVAANDTFMPMFVDHGSRLEQEMRRNWHTYGGDARTTIPELLARYAHDVDLPFTHTASERHLTRTGQMSTYARSDIFLHPAYREYLNHVALILCGQSLGEVNRSVETRMLLTHTGSSALSDVLDALSYIQTSDMRFDDHRSLNIHCVHDSIPYFESRAVIADTTTALSNIHGPDPVTIPRNNGIREYRLYPDDRAYFRWQLATIGGEGGINVIYLENIGNNGMMDVPDIDQICDGLSRARRIFQGDNIGKLFVYVDTSAMGGLFNPIDLFKKYDFRIPVNIICAESLIKYAGCGTDRAGPGFVFGSGPDIPRVFERMKIGAPKRGQPTIHTITSMPMVSHEILSQRKSRFAHNARFLAEGLASCAPDSVRITYPGLVSHPHHERVDRLYDGYGGSYFIIELRDPSLYARFIELTRAVEEIELCTSYGLNTTSLEVRTDRDSSGEKVPIHIRVSAGTENIRQLLHVRDRLEYILEQCS